MDLYLLRHGIAETTMPGHEDSLRALTSDGRQKMERIAKTLKKLKLDLDLILTSPLLRARETAEIVAKRFRSVPVEVWSELSPGRDPSEFAARLRKLKAESILAAGHEPQLSHLASLLIGAGAGAQIVMKKGGLCKIEIDWSRGKAHGSLLWLVPPAVMLVKPATA